MREAKMENWSIVYTPEIILNIDTPRNVYATFQAGRPIALFGRAKEDPRYNPLIGAFKDGNRLYTSDIVKVEGGKIYTKNTIYTPLSISENYLDWCRQFGYTVYDLEDCILDVDIMKPEAERTNPTLRYICETCGKDEILTTEEAFNHFEED
jgi:hypothetical protein